MVRLLAISLIALTALPLVGCVSQSKSSVQVVPRRGEIVAQGVGEQLSFRSPGPGLLSIFDVDANAVVHSTAIKDGTVVILNPQTGTVSVNEAGGTQTVHTGINRSHRYEMWFIAPQLKETTRP